MVKVISEKFSMKGWSLREWLIGNWSTVKEVFKVGVPFAISMFATNNIALSGLITLAGKLILDSAQYYITERKA